MNYRQPAKKDWTADQNFPRSFILFETVKHFLTALFFPLQNLTQWYCTLQTDIAEESFHMQVVIFHGMLQGNTVENTCEMSNSIGFLVGKNFRSLKWFMTMKFTNIALQTSIEIKTVTVYAQLRSSHHQGPYRSIRWIASQLTVLYSRALVSITNFNICIYISVSRKLF